LKIGGGKIQKRRRFSPDSGIREALAMGKHLLKAPVQGKRRGEEKGHRTISIMFHG